MTTEKIKVAIVGTGFGQKVHLPGFQNHPRTEVLAIYNPSLDKARAIAKKEGIPLAFDNLESLLSVPEIDAVSISTPPFLHYQMAKSAIAAKKHLLLEKPISMSAAETRELYWFARQQGVIAIADFEFRFIPAWQLLAEYLEQGYVGNKRLIKIDWLVTSRANKDRPWNWYSQKDMGGGALGSIASHSFDYINWLFGSVKSLCAYLNCAITQRPDPLSGELKLVDSDDTCLITLELSDGTPVQMSISSVTHGGRGHWVEVYGDRGTLVLGSDNLKDYVHGFKLLAAPAEQTLTELDIPKRLAFDCVFADGRLAPFIRVVDRFVTSIDVGESLIPSLQEGIYSQLLLDLCHQSHRQRSWIDVPDFPSFLERRF
jgi:predicted dehydrogenase